MGTYHHFFSMKIMNLIHVFTIGALLIYIGSMQNRTPKWAFYTLYVLCGLMILLIGVPTKPAFSYWSAIHWSHYLIFLPLLLYIAYQQKFSKQVYQAMVGVGLVIVVYHIYKFILRSGKK